MTGLWNGQSGVRFGARVKGIDNAQALSPGHGRCTSTYITLDIGHGEHVTECGIRNPHLAAEFVGGGIGIGRTQREGFLLPWAEFFSVLGKLSFEE